MLAVSPRGEFRFLPERLFSRVGIGMTGDVLGSIPDCVVHQIMRGVRIIQKRPRAKQSVRPSCVGSGLQNLIRSRVTSRTGPTPRQRLPAAIIRRHSGAFCPEGEEPPGTRSIGQLLAKNFKFRPHTCPSEMPLVAAGLSACRGPRHHEQARISFEEMTAVCLSPSLQMPSLRRFS